MKPFSRILLVILCFILFAQAAYVISWKTFGEATVEGFLSTYLLPTHRTMDHWQMLCLLFFWLLLSWSCLYVVLTDIRFRNVIRCKASKGGNTILLTDKAITRVLLNSIRRMPSVAWAVARVENVLGGGILVVYYIYWYEGESILDGGEEARRRTQAIFDKILGVNNLKEVKIITKGLKHRGESDKKIAKAVASGAPVEKKA